MIQSMTGFGKSSIQLGSKNLTIEAKSLNSKSLDLNMRMPSAYRSHELLFRQMVSDKIVRGKVDIGFQLEITGQETSAVVNAPIVKGYMKQLSTLVEADELELLKMALRMPETLITDKNDVDEKEVQQISKVLNQALEQLIAFREQEGKALEKDLLLRVDLIGKLLIEVQTVNPKRMEATRAKILQAMNDLSLSVDENRFEQEMIYYLEKLDITEEITRLNNHLNYFNEVIQSEELLKGKKLGFITQEMGREINTIGSKANFAEMQQSVIQMKDELEKIKEQLLNVL